MLGATRKYVHEIVEEYLETHGFDGLFRPEMCSCIKGDLSPDLCMTADCETGYMVPCTGGEGCAFDIGSQPVVGSQFCKKRLGI